MKSNLKQKKKGVLLFIVTVHYTSDTIFFKFIKNWINNKHLKMAEYQITTFDSLWKRNKANFPLKRKSIIFVWCFIFYLKSIFNEFQMSLLCLKCVTDYEISVSGRLLSWIEYCILSHNRSNLKMACIY